MPMKRRYIVACLAFLGFCVIYMLRVNLSVAIVAMTANRCRSNKPFFLCDAAANTLESVASIEIVGFLKANDYMMGGSLTGALPRG
jgi:hypothetical protein